jgi:putative endopeptidase
MNVFRSIVVMALALASLALAQTQVQPAPASATDAGQSKPPAKSAEALKRPLLSLPYSPSLDVTSMDKSFDPCVDFYKYSCNGWIKKNPIPGDQASWDVYGKLADENQQYLWGLLQTAALPRAKRTPAEQKIGDYFSACMDEPAIERAGAAPLKPELDSIAALKSANQLGNLLGRLHLAVRGSGMMFGFGSDQDFGDATQVIAFATAGGLGLPDRDYYTKDDTKSEDIRKKYVAHVQRMFELLGDSPAAAAQNSQTVMRIETTLAKASLTRVERRDPHKLYHKMKVADLQALTPAFRWRDYFSAAGVGNTSELNVTEPEFYKQLGLLQTSEPLSNWQTYLRWHLVQSRAPYLSSKFVQADFDFFRKYLRGVEANRPRWKRCVNYVDRDLGEALGQVFVAKTFGPEVKKATVDMVKQIDDAMEGRIRNLDWMGDETKKQALEKLHGMRNKIGYPDKWRDYSSLNIVRGDFIGNVARSTVFESKRELTKIGKPVDKGEWGMTPPTVNAYYNPQMNDINFPAGVLQPPLYDFKLDDAPNYGNTGATIGHELTHGFDDEGRQFDAQGNLRDWWTAEDAKQFEQRASCVVDQYATYTIVDNIKINSKLTEGEDVADLGGTILGYVAWKNATKDKDLKPIEGFSPDQRFFIGMAQWACGDERVENKRVNAITNPHSPLEFRINGVVSNMPEFQQAFSCKQGQPMVNAKVCQIW